MKKSILLLLLLISTQVFAHKERWDEVKDGWSPLMLAIYNNQTTQVKTLIKQNVDLNYVSKSKNSNWKLTALEVAIRLDDFGNVKLLLSTKKISHPEKLFMTACAQNNAQTVDLLMRHGANPNEELQNGYSASIMATNFGSIKVLETLLKHGVNPNHAKKNGMTVLMFAVYNCDLKKAKLLLKYGAKKETKDSKGKTALDYAKEIYLSDEMNPETKSSLIKLLS